MIERLGEFVIKKQLGEGGMGAVYLAYQESLDREVALKVLTERLCKNEKFIARFKREARSAASLIHPNVIQIYSIGEDDGIHYFAMEFVRGKDLMELVSEGRRFSVSETIDIIMQVAEACSCAAEAGIIHRDIKPANIMLTDRGLVKVTDYGLAKTTSSDLDVTEAGTIVGTANYMSPEQGQGKPLDVRTDIYSLGVVFFELLAGRVPFVADQPSSVLYMHVYEPPPNPSTFNKEVPAPVDRMVLRMMAKSVDERPADPDVLLAELRGLRQALGGAGPMISLGADASDVTAPMPVPSALIPEEPTDEADVLADIPSGALKALVADDMASVRKLYNNVLTSMGFATVEAEDGESAVHLWAEEKPALVLLDINMPKKDGIAVLQERSDRDLGGEVIVVSARKDRESVAQVACTGVCSYLTKPVNINELRARIAKVMGMPGGRLAIRAVAPEGKALSSRQIVVYDPGVHARSLFRGILESLGHQVACVSTVEDALGILDEDLPDLLVVSISGVKDSGRRILDTVKERGLSLRVIGIVPERDRAAAASVRELELGPVLSKPVRLDDFRSAVETALAESKLVERATLTSKHFTQVISEQLAHDHAFTIFDFARELAAVLPGGARRSFEKRLESGSNREVQAAVTNLLRKLRSDGRLDIGMRYVRHAYMHGDLAVRNFCLALLPELLDRKEEIDVLLKVITDEDFRIRAQVLGRLAELRAEEGLPVITRFLNDDVWKVRKEAAACLGSFDLAKVIEPLILFYARSNEALPDTIRNRLIAQTGAKEMTLLEKLAREGNTEVRAFVARFLGELRSKLAVSMLLALLKDKEPRVRAVAARSCGRVQNDRLHEGLLERLTDPNSEVLSGVVEGLYQYPLNLAAALFLMALTERGRRVPESAVAFLGELNQKESAFAEMLESLQTQSAENRKFLSLLLKHALPQPEQLNEAVRLLGSLDRAERREGLNRALAGLRSAHRDLVERMRRTTQAR